MNVVGRSPEPTLCDRLEFMYTHAPPGYRSPFLALIEGREPVGGVSRLSDVFYQDARLTAFISAARYAEAGGNALVVPNEPYENLYTMPDDLLGELHAFYKRLALAFKAVYGCDGVMVSNPPKSSQIPSTRSWKREIVSCT